MKKKEAAIIISSKRAARLAFKIKQELPGMELYTLGTHPQTQSAHPIHSFTAKEFDNYKYLIFIGALGICVRTIAPLLHSKTTDPAVINIDADRAREWIKTGAQPTETVRDLLKKAGAL